MTSAFRVFGVSVAMSFVLCGAVQAVEDESILTEDQVTQKVERVAGEIAKDAPAVIEKIKAGEHPFKDKDNQALYVFVYDKDINMVAHPNADLVGKNFKGKPDVKGKKFRDEIVDTAVQKGSGWVNYVYQKPGDTGLFDKTTYCKLTKGSDGKEYIVCCGKYLTKK